MKLALILTILLFSDFNSYCQTDTTLPVKIELKLIKSDTFFVSKNGNYMTDYLKRHSIQITGDSIKRESFDIEVSIKNTSQDSIFIWLMTCSWDENFLVNNDYMLLRSRGWGGCDHNFPSRIGFKPGESKVYKGESDYEMTLLKSIKFDYPGNNIYGYQVLETKLGLIVTKVTTYNSKLNIFAYDGFTPMDRSTWRIIWSNPLYLFGAQFEPKPIPVYKN